MKLMQYAFFGIAAVCPSVAVGEPCRPFRLRAGRPASIEKAICGALKAGKVAPRRCCHGREVTDRILSPQDYADTGVARGVAG